MVHYSIRTFWVLILCLSANVGSAQISSYYNPALQLADAQLKAALHNIIDGHTTYPYSSGSTDTWDMLKLTDRDPNNPQNVILLYSGLSVNAAQEYNNGNGWNREHVWPQSRGGFGTSQGAGTDAVNLRPCDIQLNNTRGNRVFASCVVCTPVVYNGVATGNFLDNTNGSFEPRDAIKGDIARMLFYMAVRYEGSGEPDLELVDELLPEGSSAPLMAVLSDLLAWNAADPVDAFEMNRNEVIFSFQGNRNPFVDHPELAEHLWGDLQGFAWPSSLSTSASTLAEPLYLYPNPASDEARLNQPFEQAVAYDLQGRSLRTFNATEALELEGLHSGIYLLAVTQSGGSVKLLKLIVE